MGSGQRRLRFSQLEVDEKIPAVRQSRLRAVPRARESPMIPVKKRNKFQETVHMRERCSARKDSPSGGVVK